MVKSGKVKVNGDKVKPSSTVGIGDIVDVRKNYINYRFEVVKLIKKRVGAAIAVECYKDLTPEEELRKFEEWFNVTPVPERREKGAGRPTKKERREIDKFKGSDPLELT
jgi:ribosome-associated heat shock protein Hsp15